MANIVQQTKKAKSAKFPSTGYSKLDPAAYEGAINDGKQMRDLLLFEGFFIIRYDQSGGAEQKISDIDMEYSNNHFALFAL